MKGFNQIGLAFDKSFPWFQKQEKLEKKTPKLFSKKLVRKIKLNEDLRRNVKVDIITHIKFDKRGPS